MDERADGRGPVDAAGVYFWTSMMRVLSIVSLVAVLLVASAFIHLTRLGMDSGVFGAAWFIVWPLLMVGFRLCEYRLKKAQGEEATPPVSNPVVLAFGVLLALLSVVALIGMAMGR